MTRRTDPYNREAWGVAHVGFVRLQLNDTIFRPWFTTYEQEKNLSSGHQTTDCHAQGIHRIFINFPCEADATAAFQLNFLFTLVSTPMNFLSAQGHSTAIFKPPVPALFTNVKSKSPWDITWQVQAVFSPNELVSDVITCTKVMADAQWIGRVPSVTAVTECHRY